MLLAPLLASNLLAGPASTNGTSERVSSEVTTNISQKQTITLSKDLVAAVRARLEKCTIRKGKRDYHLGPAEFVAGDERIPIEITKIAYKPYRELNDEDARENGAKDAKELRDSLKNFYPSITATDMTTIVHFDLVKSKEK